MRIFAALSMKSQKRLHQPEHMPIVDLPWHAGKTLETAFPRLSQSMHPLAEISKANEAILMPFNGALKTFRIFGYALRQKYGGGRFFAHNSLQMPLRKSRIV
jgi:hypothetical protein